MEEWMACKHGQDGLPHRNSCRVDKVPEIIPPLSSTFSSVFFITTCEQIEPDMVKNRTDSDPDWDDEDWSEDEDYGLDNQSTTTDCTHCGAEIYDDAPRCPICGEYQVGDRSLTAWQGRPLWWKLGGLIGIIAVIFGMLSFCL